MILFQPLQRQCRTHVAVAAHHPLDPRRHRSRQPAQEPDGGCLKVHSDPNGMLALRLNMPPAPLRLQRHTIRRRSPRPRKLPPKSTLQPLPRPPRQQATGASCTRAWIRAKLPRRSAHRITSRSGRCRKSGSTPTIASSNLITMAGWRAGASPEARSSLRPASTTGSGTACQPERASGSFILDRLMNLTLVGR